MTLIIPLLALFIAIGLSRRSVRSLEVAVLAGAIVLAGVVYLVRWSP